MAMGNRLVQLLQGARTTLVERGRSIKVANGHFPTQIQAGVYYLIFLQIGLICIRLAQRKWGTFV